MLEREPCPVCGHPTGDCSDGASEPIHIIGPGIFPSLGHEETIILDEDIYGERQIAPGTTAKVLLYAAGTPMKMSMAQKLGIR